LQAEIGMAIQFISHNLAVISEVSDEIIVMYAGRVVERAKAEELFERPLHPYTRGLIATLPDPSRRTARLPVIPGGVPNPDAAIAGCRFADRCAAREEYNVTPARETHPELRSVGGSHEVRCWLYHSDDRTGGWKPPLAEASQ